MRHFITRLVFLVSACLLFNECQEINQVKPNIVFILTDDQGWGDVGAHGNSIIETPAIDGLIAESASFTKFYVSPLCAPSRASFLTGKYHLNTGTVSVSRGMERMRADEVTIAELLQKQGYATGCFGKWHNGSNYPENPQGQGFDEFVGFKAGHWNNYFHTTLEFNGEMRQSQGYISDVLTNESLQFIEKNKDQPFFCYIPYNAPHGPFQVPESYFRKYQEKGLDDRLATIYGMCENLDDNIRRILNKLEELDLADNTIVVFATDNGPNGQRFNGNMKGWKGHVDEGGVRVPMLVRWPEQIEAGSKIDVLSSHIDLLPTLMDMVGLEVPEGIDGVSLAPTLLRQTHSPVARNIYTHVNFMNALTPYPGAVRDDQFLLTVKKEGYELFDLVNDPEQKQDLYHEQTKKAQALKSQYHNWYDQATKDIETARTIPAGFKQANQVLLTVQEAVFTDSLQFKEGHGWANDWLVNWKSTADSITWQVDVNDSSTYQVVLEYTVPADDVGAQISLRVGQQVITKTIEKAFDPEYLPSPDRVPRIEVYEKEWATLELGEIHLSPGQHQVILQAASIAGSQACELNRVILHK